MRRIRSRGRAVVLLATLLLAALPLAACGDSGPDLTTHAGQHEFADGVCADIAAAADGGASAILAEAFAEAAEAGTSEEQIREILAEECPQTLSEIEGEPGS